MLGKFAPVMVGAAVTAVVCLVASMFMPTATPLHNYYSGDRVIIFSQTRLEPEPASLSQGDQVWVGQSLEVKRTEGDRLLLDSDNPGWLNVRDVKPLDADTLAILSKMIEAEPNNGRLYAGRADILLEQDEYDLALPDLNEAIRLVPNATHYHMRAYYWHEKDNLPKSFADIESALKLEPNNFKAMRSLAKLLHERGDHDEANAVLDNALTVSNNHVGTVIYRGHLRMKQKLFAQAHADFDLALTLEPTSAKVHGGLGMLFAEEKRFAEAIDSYNAALQLNPGLADVQFLRAKSWMAMKEFDKALVDCDAAILRKPNNHEAYYTRAGIYFEKQEIEKALLDLKHISQANPNNNANSIRAMFELGSWESPENLQLVTRSLSEWLAKNPDDAPAHILRAIWKHKQLKHEDALKDLDQAIQLDGSSAEAYSLRAFLRTRQLLSVIRDEMKMKPSLETDRTDDISLLAEDDNEQKYRSVHEQSIKDLDCAIERVPKNETALQLRGILRAIKKEHDKAIEDFTAALAISPTNQEVLSYRGHAFFRLGKVEESLADFTAVVQINGKNAKAFIHQTRLLFRLKRYNQAMKACNAAIQKNPHLAEIFALRANVYNVQGDLANARKDFLEALRLGLPPSEEKEIKDWLAIKDQGRPFSQINAGLNQLGVLRENAVGKPPSLSVSTSTTETSATTNTEKKKEEVQELTAQQKAALIRNVIAREPNNVTAHLNLVTTLIAANLFQEASSELEILLRLDENNALAYSLRGQLHAKQSEYDLANADAQKAFELDPSLGLAHYERTKTVYDNVDPDATNEPAPSLNQAERFLARGNELLTEKDYAGAVESYEHAILADPQSAVAHFNRALARVELTEWKLAATDFEKAVELAPEDVALLQGAAWFLATCKEEAYRDGAKAIALARKACELSQWKDGPCLGTLAAAHAQAGDFAAAIQRQKEAQALYTEEEQATYGYLVALYESNKPFQNVVR